MHQPGNIRRSLVSLALARAMGDARRSALLLGEGEEALSCAHARTCSVKLGEKHAKLAVNNRARSVAPVTPPAARPSLRSSFRSRSRASRIRTFIRTMHARSVNHAGRRVRDRGDRLGSALSISPRNLRGSHGHEYVRNSQDKAPREMHARARARQSAIPMLERCYRSLSFPSSQKHSCEHSSPYG